MLRALPHVRMVFLPAFPPVQRCMPYRSSRRSLPGKTVAVLLPDTGERYFSTALYEESV